MDIFARDAIAMAKMREGVPLTAYDKITDAERQLWENLRDNSRFNPRANTTKR